MQALIKSERRTAQNSEINLSIPDIFYLNEENISNWEEWFGKLEKILNKADVLVILLSVDFLSLSLTEKADFKELILRQRNLGMPIFALIVRPCPWKRIDWIRNINIRPKNGEDLQTNYDWQLEKELEAFLEEIFGYLDIISIKQEASQHDILSLKKPKLKNTKIFISHSREDGDFAELLKYKLEKKGYTAWTDIEGLHVGEDWRGEIDKAINSCHSLIIVMSPEAKKSEYVTYEWAFALGVKKKVIPIILKETHLHPRLEALQFLDFTNREARPWHKLFSALDKV